MLFQDSELQLFSQVLVSLGLGLLVGLQRQWAESPLGGIRTFALTSLLGTSSAYLAESFGPWTLAAGFAATAGVALAGRLRARAADPEHSGLVTELALLLTFVVGAMTRTGPIWLAAALGGIVAITLQAKGELHGIASRFNRRELKAIMQFVLVALVLFPLMPDRAFGPYDVLNPHDIWRMVLLIVGISLAGYIVYKFWGEKAGVLLGGVLGGLISSTATTLSYVRSKSHGKGMPASALVITIAWATMYPRMFLEVLVAAPGFRAAWLPLGLLFVVSVISLAWMWRLHPDRHKGMPIQQNPTELKTAFTFAALYAVILLAVAFAKDQLGTAGLSLVAVVSGVTDVDAITLTTARLVRAGKIQADEGWKLLVIAALSNLAFKGALAGVLGGKALLRALLLPIALTAAAGLGLLILA